jgi:hypothetical protein
MDHVSTWFQAAVLPERWDVAGVSCTSLTVWHMFVLQQTGNPYYCGGGLDRDAAASLLMFCSRGYKDGKRLFSQPFYRKRTMAKIARALRRREWLETNAAILDYIGACMRTPAHKQQESSKSRGMIVKHAAAPICWALVDFISAGRPDSIEAAWDTTYAVARCLFDARRDIKGDDDSLESLDEERRFDAYLENQNK